MREPSIAEVEVCCMQKVPAADSPEFQSPRNSESSNSGQEAEMEGSQEAPCRPSEAAFLEVNCSISQEVPSKQSPWNHLLETSQAIYQAEVKIRARLLHP